MNEVRECNTVQTIAEGEKRKLREKPVTKYNRELAVEAESAINSTNDNISWLTLSAVNIFIF